MTSFKQPNSRSCFACGAENPDGLRLEFHKTGSGEVTSHYNVPNKFQGYPGVVQGGIVATMLDEVLIRAHMGEEEIEQPRFLFTARLDVRYRKPVPTQTRLRVVGTAIRRKARSATSKAVVYGPDGDVLAEAEGLLMDVPPEMLDGADLDSLGWRVYPDDD